MENIEDIVESMPKIIGGRYRLNILIKNFDTEWKEISEEEYNERLNKRIDKIQEPLKIVDLP